MQLQDYFWVFGFFALLVSLASCPLDDPASSQADPPSIQREPGRNYNNDTITVTIIASGDSDVYYTLDGSVPSTENGNRYTAPFALGTDNANIKDTPRPGHIQVQAVGIKEGLDPSPVISQDFQIFEKKDWGDVTTGWFTGEGEGFYDIYPIEVRIRLVNGIIDAGGADIQIGDTYAAMAIDHARDFWSRMNHWDYDVKTGATISSSGIREATKKALINAGVIQE